MQLKVISSNFLLHPWSWHYIVKGNLPPHLIFSKNYQIWSDLHYLFSFQVGKTLTQPELKVGYVQFGKTFENKICHKIKLL